jgi:hypothetical protein
MPTLTELEEARAYVRIAEQHAVESLMAAKDPAGVDVILAELVNRPAWHRRAACRRAGTDLFSQCVAMVGPLRRWPSAGTARSGLSVLPQLSRSGRQWVYGAERRGWSAGAYGAGWRRGPIPPAGCVSTDLSTQLRQTPSNCRQHHPT